MHQGGGGDVSRAHTDAVNNTRTETRISDIFIVISPLSMRLPEEHSRTSRVPSLNEIGGAGLVAPRHGGSLSSATARAFGLSRDTIAKMCRYSAPPGYVRSKPPERPKLGPLVPVIDAILEADKTAPPK